MFKKIGMNVAVFAVAVVVGVCFSYLNVAEAGIVADMFKEPVDDTISLLSENLGNSLALMGVFVAIVAAMFSGIWTGITIALGVGVIWSSMKLFA